MKGIKLRRVSIKDIPHIIEIQESITQKKISPAWVECVKYHLDKQDVVGFVAFKDSKVIGFILGEIKGPGFGLDQSGWIVVVGVNPHFMGTGIGRALADKLFGYFKKKGVKEVYTAVKWDAVDMLSFFKSIGFDRSDFINLGKHLE